MEPCVLRLFNSYISARSSSLHRLVFSGRRQAHRTFRTNSPLHPQHPKSRNLRSPTRPKALRTCSLCRTAPLSANLTTSGRPSDRVASIMSCSVHVTTLPTADTPGATFVVHHDKRSYLFGRPAEGTQRAFNSRKVAMVRMEQIFISGDASWDQMGGLVGLLLTIGNANESAIEQRREINEARKKAGRTPFAEIDTRIKIHGGDNLSHLLASTRSSVFRQVAYISVDEHREDTRANGISTAKPDWEDDALRVWKIPVKRARSSSPNKRRIDSLDNTEHDASVQEDAHKLSDPAVAKQILERFMFNGSHEQGVAVLCTLGSLRKGEVAFVKRNGSLEVVEGPVTDSKDALTRAWVIKSPTDGENQPTRGADLNYGSGERALNLRFESLPRTAYSETSMSYIFKTQDRRGKFDRQAADRLKVNVLDFKTLAAGQSVLSKEGKEVTPEMVLGEDQRGNGAVVADVPSRDFLDAFISRPEWENKEIMSGIAAFYWVLGKGLANDTKLQEFMQNHKEFKHVLCAPETCPNMITHVGASDLQMKLRHIDPERFNIHEFTNTVSCPAPPAESPIQFGRVGRNLMLAPRVEEETKNLVKFPDLVLSYNSLSQNIINKAERAKAAAANPAFLADIEKNQQDIPNRDAVIVPLGTGSSLPSKHRNVSGTLVKVPGVGNYLLDAGEGTLGQIRRFFKPEEVEDIFRNLKLIVLSHIHADHHMGCASVVKAWYEQTLKDGSNAQLAISCIDRLQSTLQEISQVEDIGYHRLAFPEFGQIQNKVEVTRPSFADHPFGIKTIKRIPVAHCWRSYATEIELHSGLRVAYSGDCRPSDLFAETCKGAHLLVHECTFDNDMIEHAKQKMHSTMAEALGVAEMMQARRTLLTHFSQRYVKGSSLKTEQTGGKQNQALLAFDGMKVKLGDFQKASCYLPVIEMVLERAQG